MAELKQARDLTTKPQHISVANPKAQPDHSKKSFHWTFDFVKKASRLEKATVIGFILLSIVLAVGTVQLRTKITQVSVNITQSERSVEGHKKEIDKLEQEKSELTRYDRVKSIAEDAQLKSSEDNVRKVNP